MIRFTSDNITVTAEDGDTTGQRQIDAIALPYNTFATVSDGSEVMFEPGSLKFERAPRVYMFHDATKVIGVVAETVDTPEAMLASMKLARTALADDALELAGMGAFAVSVGVNPTKSTVDAQGRMIVSEATWEELSLVPTPAFSGSQITQVLAQAEEVVLSSEEEPDAEPTEPTVEETQVDAVQPETVVEAATPTPLYAMPARQFRIPNAGEYIAAMTRGGADFAQMNANIRAAAGDEVLSNVDGLLPTSVVSPIFDDVNALRPLVSALGPRSMPQAGKVFIRPVITTHTQVGDQATELSALDARTMVVDDVQITKGTYGGQVTLSEQVIDFSDPSMLNAVLQDLAGQYALATEEATVSEMVGSLSGPRTLLISDYTDAEEVISDLYDAAAAIGEIGNYLPTHLVVAPKTWARLAKLVDGQQRPLFPQVGPMNAAGTMSGAVAYNGNPLGLQLVVSNQITDQAIGNADAEDFIFMFNARSIEVYEQQKGAISIDVPSTLGRTVAFRGYFAPKVIQAAGVYALGPSTA
jgi:HK97 family phage major capsid protein